MKCYLKRYNSQDEAVGLTVETPFVGVVVGSSNIALGSITMGSEVKIVADGDGITVEAEYDYDDLLNQLNESTDGAETEKTMADFDDLLNTLIEY